MLFAYRPVIRRTTVSEKLNDTVRITRFLRDRVGHSGPRAMNSGFSFSMNKRLNLRRLYYRLLSLPETNSPSLGYCARNALKAAVRVALVVMLKRGR